MDGRTYNDGPYEARLLGSGRGAADHGQGTEDRRELCRAQDRTKLLQRVIYGHSGLTLPLDRTVQVYGNELSVFSCNHAVGGTGCNRPVTRASGTWFFFRVVASINVR